ncbi:calcium-binding protein [uncultured Sulfitobacter sp.]|uniref:beta strand repeat-containing protein n=1 Tax=uncultured Sulfitobacter sp. TaxID=191468 RepID=UPI00260D5341|nr:calcium-binding protein [uncultured Sulfitobacter sp.]
MAQIDATQLSGTFDASNISNVSFNSGTTTPFSYTWTSSNSYQITALGYLGDFTPGLAGTVNGIFIATSGGTNSILSILGLNAPLTDFIDSGNTALNHEKFWNTALAGETDVLLPTQGGSLTMMGDFVRVATGQTLTGARDTFTGDGIANNLSGEIIGDALTVNAGGTLFGGNDRFINASTLNLVGDVGGPGTGNSGTVYGGDDVFITFSPVADSDWNYSNIIGDVNFTGMGGTTYGGDDTILLRNTDDISLIAGDGNTADSGSAVYGGNDVILVEATDPDRNGTYVSTIVGDVDSMSVSAGVFSTLEGGNDTITLDSSASNTLVSGDFDDINHESGASIRGGDDLINITSQFYGLDVDGDTFNVGNVIGDADTVVLVQGAFTGGDDRLFITNTGSQGVYGDARTASLSSGASLGAGNDVIIVSDDRTNNNALGNIVNDVYGDLETATLTSDVAHLFGDDTIAVTSQLIVTSDIDLYGDANVITVDGGEELQFGSDDMRLSGIENVQAYGDARLLQGNITTGGDLTVYNGDDYIETGAGNDLLVGDSSTDSIIEGMVFGEGTLNAFGGDDTLDGGLGNDTIDGGDGSDTASFASVDRSVMVFLDGIGGGSFNAIGQGNDQFISIENVIGSSRNDVIVGDSGDNVIEGGAGADNMVGNQAFSPSGAGDTLSYKSSTGFVNVSLETGFVGGGSGSHAIGDTFLNGAMSTSFRNVIGSDHNDLINGDDFDNYLSGGKGDDYLRGRGQEQSNAGLGDTLDGGEGSDWADYLDNFTNINVSLASGFANGGPSTDALGDVFISIENVRGTNFGDRITGDGEDNIFEGRLGADSLFGGGGSDTADYRASGTFVNVSLLTGFAGGGTANHANGDTFDSIENLFGSANGDVLNGSNGNNILRGRAGGDALNGNGGFDTADYTDSAGSVNVSLLTGFAGGGAGNHASGDTFSSIENLIGSRFGDTLNGDNNGNILEGGLGADVLRGNGGTDVASYANSNEGVNLSLATNFTQGGHAAGDTFISIEDVIGSAFDDSLNGDSGANYLMGGDGNDILRGRLGADTLEGSSGFDIADYGDASGAVNISLNSGFTAGSHAAGDTFTSIEGLNGSGFNDTLSGNSDENDINGGLGNDSLRGFSGEDYFIFDDNFGNDTIGDFSDGEDMLVFADNSQVNGRIDLTVTTVGGDALVADNFGNTILVQGAAGDISGSDFIFTLQEDMGF